MLAALVVAAGKGNRMGADVPKQFLKINGKSVLHHTIQSLTNTKRFHFIALVLHSDWIYSDEVKALLHSFKEEKIILVEGGKERADSVFKGLCALKQVLTSPADIVMVHDAVRPFISDELIQSLAITCEDYDSAIPVTLMKDSLRMVDTFNQEITSTVDRSLFRAVQTPQAFKFRLLYESYERAGENRSTFTDEASIFEKFIKPVKTTKGSDLNFKITTPFDLKVAEALLANEGN